jgi:hypothetical protein
MLQTSLRGGIAGAVATVVTTLEQSLDKRLFDSRYDDVEIVGKLVTRNEHWQPSASDSTCTTAQSSASHTRDSSRPCRGRRFFAAC